MEATSGFEPLNRSFADSSLRPLGYVAVLYFCSGFISQDNNSAVESVPSLRLCHNWQIPSLRLCHNVKNTVIARAAGPKQSLSPSEIASVVPLGLPRNDEKMNCDTVSLRGPWFGKLTIPRILRQAQDLIPSYIEGRTIPSTVEGKARSNLYHRRRLLRRSLRSRLAMTKK